MCVVSMIYEHYREKWTPLIPAPTYPFQPWPLEPTTTPFIPPITVTPAPPPISKEEIEEFRKLLERAREYDRQHNQPDCELDEKRLALKRLAEQLGIDIAFL